MNLRRNICFSGLLIVMGIFLVIFSGCPTSPGSSSSSTSTSSTSSSSIPLSSNPPFIINASFLTYSGTGLILTGEPNQVSLSSTNGNIYNFSSDKVSLNGSPLVYSNNTHYLFILTNSVTIASGGVVTVSVIDSGTNYNITGTNFTSYPSVSVPLSNASWYVSGSTNFLISWSGGAPTQGAGYWAFVEDTNNQITYYGFSSNNGPINLPITTTNLNVPVSAFSNASKPLPLMIIVAIVSTNLGDTTVTGVYLGNIVTVPITLQ